MKKSFCALIVALACVAPKIGFTQVLTGTSDYPTKPVRLVITSTAGGPTDLVARLLASSLEKQFKQPFVAENRPGANGLIALDVVAKSAPDGYTLVVAHSGFPQEEAKNKAWTLRFSRDFTMISTYVGGGTALVVPTTLPVNNIRELVAYAKANPGKLNQAVVGEKAQERVTLMWRKLGIDSLLTNISYKGGGPATQSVAAGEAHIWTAAMSDAIPLIQSGKIRAIGYSESERHPLMPAVPTIQESSPSMAGYTFDFWFAFMGPAGLPNSITQKLYAATQNSMKDSEFRSRVSTVGMRVLDKSPEQSTNVVNSEIKLEKELLESASK